MIGACGAGCHGPLTGRIGIKTQPCGLGGCRDAPCRMWPYVVDTQVALR